MYLWSSRDLPLDKARSEAFVLTAKVLLDAGAKATYHVVGAKK